VTPSKGKPVFLSKGAIAEKPMLQCSFPPEEAVQMQGKGRGKARGNRLGVGTGLEFDLICLTK